MDDDSVTDSAGPAFASPDEFLASVREAYRRRVFDEEPDREFETLTVEDLRKHGLPRLGPGENYDRMVDQLAEVIARCVHALYARDLAVSCAIGALEDPSVNARCIRSPEGFYAAVIHYGLMNLLHKHTKLLVAASDPSEVVWCNRKNADSLRADELRAWAEELGEIYLATGETRGAFVKLSEGALATAGLFVRLGETFVIGHEVGHFLAGHLEAGRFIQDPYLPWLEVFAENEQHEQEFEADAYGFEIVCGSHATVEPSALLRALISAYLVMALISGDRAAVTHPAASERFLRLVDRYFEGATGERIRDSLERGDPAEMNEAVSDSAFR